MSNQMNDQHRATEPSVAEMANMMDFGGGHSQTTGSRKADRYTANQHDDEDENAVFDVEAIEDEDSDFFSEEFNPEKNATKVGFRKNGLAKGTLVAVTGLVAVVGGLTFFQGQVPKGKVAEVPQKKDASEEKVENAQSDATKAQQSESEIKAELALSKQKDALEQSNSNKTTDPTTAKTTTDPNTKVATTPAPSVPIVPPVKPNRANGFVASPVVPPIAIPPSSSNNGSTKVATVPAAPFVPPANKNNISIPPAGITPLQTVSAPKLATTPVGALINKNTSPAPAAVAQAFPIAKSPGVPKAETASPKTPTREIAKIDTAPSTSIRESRSNKRQPREEQEELTRLPIARIPGVPADTQIASNTLPPPPLYPQPNTNNLQPFNNSNTIPPVAINPTPSLIDFLKTSTAADNPAAIPVGQTQLVAMNKDQSKDKQIGTVKDPRAVLQAVPVTSNPVVAQQNKDTNLIASSNIKNIINKNKYSSLISPNSPLADIINPPSFGISPTEVASAAIANNIPNTVAQDIKPALAQGLAPGTSSTRPAYAYTKMLLAGLPDANMSLGNVEQVSSNNQQINQVNKSQVVSQNNPVLNQPIPNTPEQSVPTTVPGTPVSPVSPVGPIAASILTGTSAKGTTLTPILWGAESATGAKFVAKLEEPLLANNKREALPAGTQLIVMAKPSSNNGGNNSNSLVEVNVVGVIVQGKEYATPPGAIVIHDENNGLLVGEDYFKREDQIASRDYMTVLGGALNTLGQVLNRPSGSFSSNSSGFGSSSTNIINNRDPNVFGALLEGGFKDIPGIWNQRNQQALAQLANQPKVYQIPKGRTIRVFVNQSIIF